MHRCEGREGTEPTAGCCSQWERARPVTVTLTLRVRPGEMCSLGLLSDPEELPDQQVSSGAGPCTPGAQDGPLKEGARIPLVLGSLGPHCSLQNWERLILLSAKL